MKTSSGRDFDEGYCVKQTTDNGFIITGHTFSFGLGLYDVLLIKTDKEGKPINKTVPLNIFFRGCWKSFHYFKNAFFIF